MLHRPLRDILLVLTLLAGLAPGVQALGTHKDERLGFQIQVPSGWDQIPLQTTEQWIVAKYVSPKAEFWTDPSVGYTHKFKPEMRVIAFIDEVIQKSDFDDYDYKKEEGEEDDEEETDEEKERKRRIKLRTRVYRDYEDYLTGTLAEGYYLAEDPVQKEVNGYPVEIFEVKIEATARRVVTWVFDTDIAHIAIEFDFFEHQLRKERRGMERTFKSFKAIDRTISLGLDEMGSFISISELFEKSPEERAKYRRAEEDRTWERMISEMPDGWETDEISGVRVLSCVDSRYNKRLVERLKAVRKFLDDTFPELGPDEYVRYPLLRICKDREEVNKFRNIKGQSWSFNFNFTTELVTYKDDGGARGFESAMVNRRALSMWLQDRNYRLALGLPGWIDAGLTGTMVSATVRGTRMKHGPSDWEREWIRRIEREERIIPARELMLMTEKEHAKARENQDFGPYFQSVALTRYLAVGGGSKGKYKDLLESYVINVAAVLAELDAERAAEREAERERKRKEKEAEEAAAEEDEDDEGEDEEAEDDKPKTEEEEEKELEERKKELAAQEKRILKEALERTFEGWSDRDWSAFEDAYARELR